MRAARLLDILLALQRRGRLTTRELSAALEVSQRTILRDVEALSEAGVPIRTRRGARGGIELMEGFETRLTGLTSEEAACLFLVGQPDVADWLGLATPTRSVQHKLTNAIERDLAAQAEALSTWFVHDSAPWHAVSLPRRELRRIAGCIGRHHRLELLVGDRPPVTVEPWGLVLKAGSWYLVGGVGTDHLVICLDELRSTRLTTQRFDVPESFSLSDFWAAHVMLAPSLNHEAHK